MKLNLKMLNIVKYVSLAILGMGLSLILVGLFTSGTLASIGIGTVIGAVFIFLIGVFFVATEEMLEKSDHGVRVAPIRKKGAPRRHSF